LSPTRRVSGGGVASAGGRRRSIGRVWLPDAPAAGGAFAAVGRVVLGHAVAVVPQPGPGRRLGDPRLLEERGDRRVATGQLARALEALDGGVGIALAQERLPRSWWAPALPGSSSIATRISASTSS
jgi:hypothetical protein